MVIPALFHQCILVGVRRGRQEAAHKFLFIWSIAKLRKAIFGLDGKYCLTSGFLNPIQGLSGDLSDEYVLYVKKE